jgi:DNA-directed RNA polymerase alpha subunit/DNA-directed RNA polymerase subunit L
MEFKNYKLKRPNYATFVLAPCHVAYANTLRRLIMTGVESVAFRADMKDGTTTDVKIEINDTPMTNEMLAHRFGLLPIYVKDPFDIDLTKLKFSIDVKANKDSFRDVTCNDFVIEQMREGGLEPIRIDYDKFFPEDPITKQTCLIATLAPGEGRLKMTATASVGTGRENARFQPTSQCSYTYTRDMDEEKIKSHFQDWLRKSKNVNFGSVDPKEESKIPEEEKAKIAILRREYNNMEIAKVYLRDAKGEPFSYDFAIESVGPLSIPYMVRRACDVGEAMMGKYTTIDSGALPSDNKLYVIPSQSRVIGFDFVMKEQDHTFGNMIQTYLEQNHIYEAEEKADGPAKITYAGYEVPHPLRDEMVVRIGATSKAIALKAFAQACRGCVQIFRQMRAAWSAAVPEAGTAAIKAAVKQKLANVEAVDAAKSALKAAVTELAEAKPEKSEKPAKPAVVLKRKKTAV